MKPLPNILNAVSQYTQVPVRSILSKRRHAPLALARHYFMYLAWKQGYRWVQIGRFLKVDHSSCIHGAQRIDRERYSSDVIESDIRELLQLVQSLPDAVGVYGSSNVANYGFVTLA